MGPPHPGVAPSEAKVLQKEQFPILCLLVWRDLVLIIHWGMDKHSRFYWISREEGGPVTLGIWFLEFSVGSQHFHSVYVSANMSHRGGWLKSLIGHETSWFSAAKRYWWLPSDMVTGGINKECILLAHVHCHCNETQIVHKESALGNELPWELK